MKVALAGGTGFTGRRIALRLAAKSHALACLVRPASDRSVLPPGAGCVAGDLGDAASLKRWLAGCEGLVFAASMGFGHVADIVAAAERAGVRRAVFISTTAIFTMLPAPSKAARVEAEERVRTSRLAWTILRPTMIYGAPGDRNMERLLRAVSRWPLLFVPGSGGALIQPVHVDDLADAVVAAFHTPGAERREYVVSGRAPLSLDATITAAAHAVGKRRARVHLPLKQVAATLRLLERWKLPMPVKPEQVMRLAEDKAFSHLAASRDFGFRPRPFEEGIVEEARALGLAKASQ